MMKPVERIDDHEASATEGEVKLDLQKSAWVSAMLVGSVLAPFYFTWTAFLLFLITTYITLLFGHSIGMHRMMIHRSFDAPRPLKRLLIFIGVLVGMGGPTTIIKIHDTRDWAQRLETCHEFFSHNRHYLQDIVWQLFYKFEFVRPPICHIEVELTGDLLIQFFDKYWWAIQLTLAATLMILGGIELALWVCCMRVFISILGHWTITYFCHNPGPGDWHVKGAGVQASNLGFGGFLTHGECWHNNHHAFPESAQIGLQKNQLDPAWVIIRMLERLGWVSDVKRPRAKAQREDLIKTSS